MTKDRAKLTARRARGRGWALVPALALALVLGREARAATVCGTIITNVATATMTSGFPDFIGYAVSYNATQTVVVLCPPVVALQKWANGQLTSEGASGSTVTFQICISNQQIDTAWNISISDRLPDNMYFVDQGVGPGFDLSNPNLGAPVFGSANSVANLATMGGAPPAGQGAPYYLRWTYKGVGPQKSACVVYRAAIL